VRVTHTPAAEQVLALDEPSMYASKVLLKRTRRA
jgi:hypothetical protein